MINDIEIKITSGSIVKYKGKIDVKNKACYMNDQKYPIEENIINKILRILTTWKYEYGESSIFDSEEFTIIVHSDKRQTKYHGKGVFPANYITLLEIIKGVIKNE